MAKGFEEKFKNVNFSTNYETYNNQIITMMVYININQKEINDPTTDPLTMAQEKVDEVKGIMTNNIEQIMNNQEKLGEIDAKSMKLVDSSAISFLIQIIINLIIYEFKSNAGTLKDVFTKQRIIMMALIGGVCCCVYYYILVYYCCCYWRICIC